MHKNIEKRKEYAWLSFKNVYLNIFESFHSSNPGQKNMESKKSRIKKYGIFFANSSSFVFVVFICFIVIVFSLQTLLLVILIWSNFIKKVSLFHKVSILQTLAKGGYYLWNLVSSLNTASIEPWSYDMERNSM